ncbi:MAG: four helix bundle protein [Candidatus Brocadiia bacterium]
MSEELKERMQVFALDVIRLTGDLPHDKVGDVIGRQLLKCGTSVGANYRAASRAKSQADFVAKMGIVEEESDESLYWLELLIRAGLAQRRKVAGLLAEADQFVAIAVASIRTARRNK